MTQTQEKCCAAIAQQQKQYREGTLEYGVSEMLQMFARANEHDAELIMQDIANEEMGPEAAAEKLYEFAKKDKSGNSYCMTPAVAEKLLRKFYGLSTVASGVTVPKQTNDAAANDKAETPAIKRGGRIDLADFL